MAQRRVLIVQTAFIGDVVLTTPMLQAFRKHFPEDHLSVMIKPEARTILEHHPAIDNLIVIDKQGQHRNAAGMLRLGAEIHKARYDILLSPHKSHRTSMLARLSKIPDRYGYKNAGFAKFAYNHLLHRPMHLPEIDRLMQFLDDALGCHSENYSRELFLKVDNNAYQESKTLLRDLDAHRPILMAPSSVWPTKRWTAHGFARLARLLIDYYHSPVLLIGSPADKEVAEDVQYLILKTAPEYVQNKVKNICGLTSLPGLFALMQSSQLLVSNDSAPVHFGCAAGIPVTAIFGPTSKTLGYAPIAKKSNIAELTNLDCRPCGTHGAKRCPRAHFRCMQDLTAEMVMQKINSLSH